MDGFGKMVDDDGTIFYETENGELLLEIIRLDDVGVLARYLETNAALGPRDVQMDDPFWNAVFYGSTNVLCALLQHWDATQPSIGTDMPAPDRRGFGLLQTACEFSHIETVRFLLNGPWSSAYGDIHARDCRGSTALLAAAGAFFGPGFIPSRSMTGKQDSHGSMRSHLVHAEEVMQLLLDRDARVGDGIITRDGLQETVLSRAITGASSALVKRLIDQGADAYAKTTYDFFDGSLYGGFGPDTITRDVSPLHMGSLYFNTAGVRVLLNHARATGGVDMVKVPDSHGRLPLHWAAWGLNESDELYGLKADEIVPHVTATIELLMAAAPSTVNAQDDRGDTPLHYAVRRHGRCGDRHVAILRTLCEHGADAGLGGRNGETPLHGLGFRFRDGEPIEARLIDLLLEHGASVGDADDDGNTPLHFAAKHLAHVEAAQHLLSRGADVSVQNSQGNTPLHEAALGFYSGPLGGSQPRERKLTLENRVRAQDEMMRVLLHSFSETKANALMNQTNADYETPRQICQERRRKWRDEEITHKPLAMGRGRRRG
ncbi:hypothetical protein J7T55_000891 [Diaporthe amygdali]|uniref:uncharacterized protein n=1 Tax=Phomopsis amygdali TaxID=1214568 RepID=UPI0022FE848A|nr:uncharacterized protein J7T55_000891 [Diaporthe amygdali]KAJ0120038.1 hypothetical protein J7T55_000891 [Diaporthe amygdali]